MFFLSSLKMPGFWKRQSCSTVQAFVWLRILISIDRKQYSLALNTAAGLNLVVGICLPREAGCCPAPWM